MEKSKLLKDFAMKVVEKVLEYNLKAESDCIEIHQFDHYGENALQVTNNLTMGTPGRVYGFYVLNALLSETKMEEALKILTDELAEANEVF